ncbi:hypothetical protein C7441_102308 [Pseudaminobacter salicylatoxidans]|uniref:Uncharacterized protein n=1 Tax=Pseudaminobacter salicylatoxidans TaxID=93369 RepID=A0A316C865_PSESE|nr:hypothetical protein [Pseudaminobacter salicylatoxidans]PWJ85860.1 hypothetical protein C7441_102308 [Pseudaminobacter salicylatoxidans]
MKIYVKIAAGILALLVGAAFVLWYRVASVGQEALLDIATQANLCKTADCAEGIDEASSYLAEEFGLSPRLVEWCVGVDTLSERMGQKGLVNRSWWINLLYEPCGEPVVD